LQQLLAANIKKNALSSPVIFAKKLGELRSHLFMMEPNRGADGLPEHFIFIGLPAQAGPPNWNVPKAVPPESPALKF
jgi:hypothetical protein